jgi:hypothetical protein
VRIAIVGSGRIGENCARQLAKGGHEVMLSFSRDPAKLDRLAADIGPAASAGSPADAVAFADVVVFAVPWTMVDEALALTGPLDGKIVIDTTNQFGRDGWEEHGETAAARNAPRMPGARYTKSFNTLTSAFQAEAAGRTGDERVVQWICGDDEDAKRVVARLLVDAGYVPVDLGGTEGCEVMEAPRRPGAVYGEEYRAADAQAVVDAVRAGRPIPATPQYS